MIDKSIYNEYAIMAMSSILITIFAFIIFLSSLHNKKFTIWQPTKEVGVGVAMLIGCTIFAAITFFAIFYTFQWLFK